MNKLLPVIMIPMLCYHECSDARATREGLEGRWAVINVEPNFGKVAPHRIHRIVFAGDKITIEQTELTRKGTFSVGHVDATKTIEIWINSYSGEMLDESGAIVPWSVDDLTVIRGVYSREGDILKVHWMDQPHLGADSPTDFTNTNPLWEVLTLMKLQ